MADFLALALSVALLGIGATIVLDLWSLFLKTVFRVALPNMAMVGRWIGYFPRGRFVHASVAQAQAIPGEHIIGWIAHYGIGILFAALLVAFTGAEWLRAPTLLPALIIGIVTVAAPFFVMQPSMGLGFAASKAPTPNVARLRSLVSHTVFGIGLYLSAAALAFLCDARAPALG